MSVEKYVMLLDKFYEEESWYEKGRIAAEMYSLKYGVDPQDLKEDILSGKLDDDRSATAREMDRGGVAWCDEQLAARS